MPRPPEPECPLCKSGMTKEENVVVGRGVLFGLIGGTTYDLAWVCRGCSTAVSIALGKGRLVGDPQPMFRKGEKT